MLATHSPVYQLFRLGQQLCIGRSGTGHALVGCDGDVA